MIAVESVERGVQRVIYLVCFQLQTASRVLNANCDLPLYEGIAKTRKGNNKNIGSLGMYIHFSVELLRERRPPLRKFLISRATCLILVNGKVAPAPPILAVSPNQFPIFKASGPKMCKCMKGLHWKQMGS